MTEAKQTDALRIEIAAHQMGHQHGRQWALSILWRFTSATDQTTYLLLDQPLVTTIADPLVLDHTAHDPGLPLDVNAMPDFEIVAIAAHDTLERQMAYYLNLPNTLHSLQLIGRFGYSTIAPDPGWERHKNWQQVERWQQVVESNTATVMLQP
ncbi:MAG TPA: hypothetical protein VFZ66_04075 [Herpetosiphonaceae bacterium]